VKEKDLPKGKPQKETSVDMVDLEKNRDDCTLFLTRRNEPICFSCLYIAAIPNSGPIEDL